MSMEVAYLSGDQPQTNIPLAIIQCSIFHIAVNAKDKAKVFVDIDHRYIRYWIVLRALDLIVHRGAAQYCWRDGFVDINHRYIRYWGVRSPHALIAHKEAA